MILTGCPHCYNIIKNEYHQFDAKYKVDNLAKLFGKNTENLDEEKAEQRAGKYKRVDLLKMHAYRDAIRRSAGAYVLYPGTDEKNFKGFHELLPGLGAFPLRPNELDPVKTESIYLPARRQIRQACRSLHISRQSFLGTKPHLCYPLP